MAVNVQVSLVQVYVMSPIVESSRVDYETQMLKRRQLNRSHAYRVIIMHVLTFF